MHTNLCDQLMISFRVWNKIKANAKPLPSVTPATHPQTPQHLPTCTTLPTALTSLPATLV